MARTVILFTGQWADLSLEELADKASEGGATRGWSCAAGATTSRCNAP